MKIDINNLTESELADSGERWNVAPGLLHRVVEGQAAQVGDPNVFTLRRK